MLCCVAAGRQVMELSGCLGGCCGEVAVARMQHMAGDGKPLGSVLG